MFHDLLLWSFLSSGIFLISATLLVSMLYSSATTKIQYLKTVRKLDTLQHAVLGKRYLENIELCPLKPLTLARWDSQALLGESEGAACCPGPSPPCGGQPASPRSQSWRKGLTWIQLFQGWLREAKNSLWLHKMKSVSQLQEVNLRQVSNT